MSFGLLRKSKPENVQRRSQESPLRREINNLRQPRNEKATYYYHRDDNSSQENQRRLRRIREEKPNSKPKAVSKSYTANPTAKGKAEDSTSKARDKGDIAPKEAEVAFDSFLSSEEHVEILVKDELSVTSSISEKATAKEQEKKESYQDQLLLESKNEAVMKHELGRADDSAYEVTERYSLLSTPDSYTLEFKVVEEVDYFFGDSAFSKPGNNVKSLLAEIMKPSREKQLPHFWLSKTEPIVNIEGEKHKDFKLFMGMEVAKAITLGKCMFLKEIGTVTTAQRRSPIMDKVRDGRRVIEPEILDYYGVPEESNERILSLYLEVGVLFKPKMHEARPTLQVPISGGEIKLPKVSYLKLMKDLSHPFDPGNQI